VKWNERRTSADFVAALVIMAPVALFSDGGHLGSRFVPMLAAASPGSIFRDYLCACLGGSVGGSAALATTT